jgi:hypothetical protein
MRFPFGLTPGAYWLIVALIGAVLYVGMKMGW